MTNPTLTPSRTPTPVRGLLLSPKDRPTGGLDGVVADTPRAAIEVLDHRGRQRTVPQRQARRGHHLMLGRGPGEPLLPLTERLTHVGRSLTSQVRLEDVRVSREHAIFVRHGEYMRVLDNRSANGTYVNGRRVLATTLADGDLVQVGPVEMRYMRID